MTFTLTMLRPLDAVKNESFLRGRIIEIFHIHNPS